LIRVSQNNYSSNNNNKSNNWQCFSQFLFIFPIWLTPVCFVFLGCPGISAMLHGPDP